MLISSFGIDEQNELYICSFDGRIYKFRSTISSIDPDNPNILPKKFYLGQNYPNPFNLTTNIPFYIEYESNVEISVYDSQGKFVDTLVNKYFDAGKYNIKWEAKDQKNST